MAVSASRMLPPSDQDSARWSPQARRQCRRRTTLVAGTAAATSALLAPRTHWATAGPSATEGQPLFLLSNGWRPSCAPKLGVSTAAAAHQAAASTTSAESSVCGSWRVLTAAAAAAGAVISLRAYGGGGGYGRDRGYGGGDRGGGGGGDRQMRQDAQRDQKRQREATQFFAYQKRLISMGCPPRDDIYWSREERMLFKEEHVERGINFKDYDDIPVERKGGQGNERPAESFQEVGSMFHLPQELVDNFERCHYSVPTPVQKHAVPAACAGSDVMVSAQTGSGKTAAFLVPVIAAAIARGQQPVTEVGPVHPTCVILAPTRELCQQIAVEAKRLTFRSPCRVVAVYGGADAMPQLKQLAEGCEIAICTPGRLEDFLERGVITVASVKYLVLDEADRMLDMGFEPQIRSIIEQHDMPPSGLGEHSRNTMMFSATFPKEMRELASDFLDPSYLWIGVGRVGATTNSVEQRFEDMFRAGDKEKMDKLLEVLEVVKAKDGGPAKTIIFANQKNVVDDVAWRLSDSRVRTSQIHGGLTQAARDRALNDLRTGRINVLVATDVAARGLDLPGVDHVINYDLPENVDSYVHRIGRTGRIGNTGVATSFVGRDEPALQDIVMTVKQQIAESRGGVANSVPEWLEDAAAMQAHSRGGPRGGRFRSGSAPPRGGGRFRDDRPRYDDFGRGGGVDRGRGRGGSRGSRPDYSDYGEVVLEDYGEEYVRKPRGGGGYDRGRGSYGRGGGGSNDRGGSYGRGGGSYDRDSYGGRGRGYDDDNDDDSDGYGGGRDGYGGGRGGYGGGRSMSSPPWSKGGRRGGGGGGGRRQLGGF